MEYSTNGRSMHDNRTRSKGLVALLTFTTLICLLAIGGLYLLGRLRLPPDLLSAEIRWATRPFTHYRMVIASTSGQMTFCDKEIQVQNGVVTKIIYDTCPDEPTMTIDDLFKQLENDTTAIDWITGRGCSFMAVYPAYDIQLGYPRQIEYRQVQATRSNLGELNYFISRLPGAPTTCYGLLVGKPGIIVKSLTPLP